MVDDAFVSAPRAEKSLFAYGLLPGTRITALTTGAEMANHFV
jgi:hypothetical protein